MPKRGKFLIFFASVWLIVGLPLFFIGVHLFNLEMRFAREGQTTSGIVLSKSTEVTRDSKNKSSTHYYVHYRFTANGAQKHESKSALDYEVWDKFKEQDPIEITYLPSDPENNRAAQSDQMVLVYVLLGVGAVCLGIGIISLSIDIKQRLLTKRLLREGTLAEATVVSVGPGNLSINKVEQWRIWFDFKDTSGKTVEGVTSHMPPDAAEGWKKGAKGKVRYDRQNPRKHIWIGA